MNLVVSNILLFIVSGCTMVSYLPQIFKLMKFKSAEGISIFSWVLWVFSSLCYFGYAILSNDIMLIISCSLTLVFCLIVLTLSIHYDKVNKKTLAYISAR